MQSSCAVICKSISGSPADFQSAEPATPRSEGELHTLRVLRGPHHLGDGAGGPGPLQSIRRAVLECASSATIVIRIAVGLLPHALRCEVINNQSRLVSQQEATAFAPATAAKGFDSGFRCPRGARRSPGLATLYPAADSFFRCSTPQGSGLDVLRT